MVELSIETHMAITGPGRNAGRGESGLSEKGEKAEIRALADDGGLNGERTAIIMATRATRRCREVGDARTSPAATKGTLLGATRLCLEQRALARSASVKADLQAENCSYHAWAGVGGCVYLFERCRVEMRPE